jgi:DNA-directed RNA polymerase specialized sigma24 family protein
MAKGNPGGHKANLPFPELSDEEKREILILSRYRESFSYQDIAQILNEVFKEYNKGCRTREGVKKFLAKPQEPEKAAG